MDLVELSRHYRRRAEHLRQIATRFYSTEARDGLLQAAATWDELAVAAERDRAWQRQSAALSALLFSAEAETTRDTGSSDAGEPKRA
jgi:hypothetical protein